MQIITLDNIDFPSLQDSLNRAHKIGTYIRDGRTHLVFANPQFVFVTALGVDGKIAIKPSRSMTESTAFAKQILNREAARGAQIQMVAG